MDIVLTRTIALLGVAIVVALAARRLRLPYTVGLVSRAWPRLTHRQTGLELTHDLIFDIILPPLLFEAALSIGWNELRRGSCRSSRSRCRGRVSAAVAAAGMMLSWLAAASAFVFGALIGATDRSRSSLCSRSRRERPLRLLVESESLFNDGAAAVLFTLVLVWTHAPGNTPRRSPRRAPSSSWRRRRPGGAGLCGVGERDRRADLRSSRRNGPDRRRRLRLVPDGRAFPLLGGAGEVAAGLPMGNLGRVHEPGEEVRSFRRMDGPLRSSSGSSRRLSPIRWCSY